MNCLRTGHITSRCRLSRCKYCKGKHNTLLHVDDQTMSTSINNSMPSSSSSVALPIDIAGISSTNCPTGNVALSCDTIIQNTTSSILLSTAMVKVVSDDGEKFDARILLDNVKAVHIELVTDLSKEGYMSALNRFVARRGKPQSILSDNGTNFVGACNELQTFLQKSDISYEVTQQGIEFAFAPPYSPHFNGIAEAAVRSTKHHLRRLLQVAHFTYEEMATCLTQIEAVLNSRPLTPISSDPLDLTALTPSHFLIGRPLMSVPHPQVIDIKIERLERYHRVQHIKQHFWQRFHLEYISLLQQKTKWTSSTGQLSAGTLVLVKDRGQPPLLWLLGRVTKVFPGIDGAARVAELKTKKGTILRAFNNLCPLPVS
ncbi:uncharacterized protein LOC131855693 [Achroia grisella]|uniref:uncharacterized protein LOC131855693 n=1 Tax=Achroia grisella TaxID=688607 RepID=UPI0027D27459|nr:uncharacterized protein LOC131855693 [Achroia grisella]